jgi:hypothetical protein
MASFSFKTLNIISLLLALAIFGITVAAACVTWYQSADVSNRVTSSAVVAQSNPKTVISSTTFLYSLQGITTKLSTNNQKVQTNTFNLYVDGSARFSIVKLSQAFTLIALIVSALLSIVIALNFFASFRDKLIFTIGATLLRKLMVVFGMLIVISVVIAFLAWTGITQAFANDIPNCITGPCLKFVDSESNSTLNDDGSITVRDISWGPTAGWYLVLACIPVSILFTIVVTLNKYPIPIDSIGTGEAL